VGGQAHGPPKYVKHLTIFPAVFEGEAIVRDGH